MSPKGVAVFFAGTGGTVVGGYTILNFYSSGSEIIITNTTTIPEGLHSNICATPAKKATITTDDSVVYYICTKISNPSVTTTTAVTDDSFTVPTSKAIFTKDTTFKTETPPTKGTYKPDGATNSINIYGYTDTTKSQNTFYIEVPTTEWDKIDLKTHKGIRELIQDIEKLRIYQSITISTQTTTPPIDSITCTEPKTATTKNQPKTEYHICKTITGTSSGKELNQTITKNSQTFTHDTVFKTKKGEKHTITKGLSSKNDTKKFHFYQFKPNEDNITTDKEIFFLSNEETTQMTDTVAKNGIFKIMQFAKNK